MAWDFESEPEFDVRLQWMRSFIDRDLIPLEPVLDHLPRRRMAGVKRHLQDQVTAQCLWAAFLDPKLGGNGVGPLKLALMSEIIGRRMYSMGIFGDENPTAPTWNCWLTVPPMLRKSAGDEWVLEGHKWFITDVSVVDIVIVFAETNPDGRPHGHASVFVVRTGTPGTEIVRDIATMTHPESEFGRLGNHAEIVLHHCRIPADHLIGQPGEGFSLAQQRLGGGRIHHALRWFGQAAARLLTFQTAWKMDKYGAAAVVRSDLGMVEAHVSKVVLAVLDRTIQVCGALGYFSDLPVEAWYRSTRFGPIGEPDELHKSLLARTLSKCHTPVDGRPSEHIPSRRPAAETKWAGLKTMAGVE